MKLILASAFAVAATLASLGAGAASAQSYNGSASRIPYGDLNLSTAAGASAFDARVESTAQVMCKDATRPGSRLKDTTQCAAAVRAEAMAQLPVQARARYAANRQPITL